MSTPRRPDSPSPTPQWAKVSSATRPASPRPVAPRPAAPKPAKPSARSTQVTKKAPPVQRRPETSLADGAKGTVTALALALGKAKDTLVPPVTVRRDEREAEKRAAKRRRLAIVWGRRTGYVLVAGAGVWLVLLSPVFALDPQNVQVTGYGTVVDPTAVREVVEADAGTSLATLSAGQLTSQLKDIPGVREAHVERSWPDGLVITLESREPAAAIPSLGGGFVLVDDEGVQVGRASKAPKDLPTLAVPADNAKVLTAALTVITALPAELRDRVDSVSAPTVDSVSFDLSKGPTVEWGSAEDTDLKIKVLETLLTSKQARKADVIDVSAPTLPITTNN
jgi:cell division protein FtsQ